VKNTQNITASLQSEM